MNRLVVLYAGSLATVVFATAVLVVTPVGMLGGISPPAALEAYTEEEAHGRQVYIANGCIYCHSQQVRDAAVTTDSERGWGRPSVPVDYYYDSPHLLGTMRTGPDLINVGARLPDARWHLAHLYQPRALVPWSIMPSYPFLFRIKERADPGDTVVELPDGHAPPGKVVVATDDALALTAYLLSLKRTFPVEPASPGGAHAE